MHASGIICEYNPFHNGHKHHIEQTRKLTNCDVLVCVMSGNFVQRGEPAIVDKWIRTKTALQQGVDLVIELPIAFATQSAKQFAQGAVTSLSLAQVKDIVFGSEINDLTTLLKIATIDSSKFRDFMQDGVSPTRAYEAIYGVMNPNDILGINYLQALKDTNIQPYTIKRTNAYHDETIHSSIASASAIRKAIKDKQDISMLTCIANELSSACTLDVFYPLIKSLLLTLPVTYLQTLFLMDEGIEAHLIKCAKDCDNFDAFLQKATTKRYSTSKIRRTLLHLIFQTTKEEMNTLPPLEHIRVLGFNSIGKQYLKYLKEKDVTIASRFNQIPLVYRNMEMKATQLYNLYGPCKDVITKELQGMVYLP